MSDCCTCSVPTLLSFHPWYLKVFNKLPVQKLSGFSYRVEDREPDRCSQPWEEMEESTAKDDVYRVFKVRYE